MRLIHMTPQALSCFQNSSTQITLKPRVVNMMGLNMSRSVSLQFVLLPTVQTSPDTFAASFFKCFGHFSRYEEIKVVKA